MLMRTYRVLLWGIIIYSVGELSEKCQRLVLYIYIYVEGKNEENVCQCND